MRARKGIEGEEVEDLELVDVVHEYVWETVWEFRPRNVSKRHPAAGVRYDGLT